MQNNNITPKVVILGISGKIYFLRKFIPPSLFYLFNYITFMTKYDILKTMTALKKFWIVFVSFLPLSAGAIAPFVIGAIAGGVIIAGFSIYRSFVPVDMSSALQFFSSCWSCQLFSDILSALSGFLPRIYSAMGSVVVPFAVALTAIWFTWKLFSGYLNAQVEEPWNIATSFSVHLIKLGFLSAILLMPLPRLMGDIAITPIFNIGLSLNRVVAGNDEFAKCVVATALADPVTVSETASQSGAYSPRLRHDLTCEIANVHQMTGLGMTVGWTMMNMSFNNEYMHKLFNAVPIFPNIPMFFGGLLVLGLFFAALLPIPMYFLEIFIKLSMDLIMVPLMMLSWLFKDWKIFPQGGGKNLRAIIDDVVQGAAGIAMVGVFVTFAVMFLNAIFGRWNGASRLVESLAQNDSTILIDGLMFRNESFITMIMMGVFMAMFMVMIPALVKTLFAKVAIPTTFYDSVKNNLEILGRGAKKWYDAIKNKK